jgi:DNA-binding Lrp family transcriptional regulator
MKDLRAIDYKILFELMKDSKRSDRQLAKVLNVSQPTVTRRRATLEKELIDGYTAIPKWEKMGYEIFAITFFKVKQVIASKEHYADARKRGMEWLMKKHNIIMAGSCRGMGMDSFNLSFHKSYGDYDEWMRNFRLELGDLVEDIQSVLINLGGQEVLKPLNLKYLAETEQT